MIKKGTVKWIPGIDKYGAILNVGKLKSYTDGTAKFYQINFSNDFSILDHLKDCNWYDSDYDQVYFKVDQVFEYGEPKKDTLVTSDLVQAKKYARTGGMVVIAIKALGKKRAARSNPLPR